MKAKELKRRIIALTLAAAMLGQQTVTAAELSETAETEISVEAAQVTESEERIEETAAEQPVQAAEPEPEVSGADHTEEAPAQAEDTQSVQNPSMDVPEEIAGDVSDENSADTTKEIAEAADKTGTEIGSEAEQEQETNTEESEIDTEEPELIYDLEHRDSKVTVSAHTQGVPTGTELQVKKLNEADSEYVRAVNAIEAQLSDTLLLNENTVVNYLAYDISLVKDGAEFKHSDDVQIVMDFHRAEALNEGEAEVLLTEVVHVSDEGVAEIVTDNISLDKEDAVEQAVFTQDSFSPTVLVQVSDADAYVKTVTVKDYTDGTGVFDEAEGRGNDTGKKNGIIRSYDTMTYYVQANYQVADGVDIEGAVIYYDVTLPDNPELELDWSASGLDKAVTAVSNGDRTKTYTLPYEIQTNQAGGSGLIEKTIVVNVNGEKQGYEFTPKFTTWFEGNTDSKVSVDGPTTKVTTAPMYNIILKQGGTTSKSIFSFDGTKNKNEFDGTTYEATGYTGSSVTGFGVTYGVALEMRKADTSKGIRGIEYPDPNTPLTFTIDLGAKYKSGGTETETTSEWAPILYSVQNKSSRDYKLTVGQTIGDVREDADILDKVFSITVQSKFYRSEAFEDAILENAGKTDVNELTASDYENYMWTVKGTGDSALITGVDAQYTTSLDSRSQYTTQPTYDSKAGRYSFRDMILYKAI